MGTLEHTCRDGRRRSMQVSNHSIVHLKPIEHWVLLPGIETNTNQSTETCVVSNLGPQTSLQETFCAVLLGTRGQEPRV